MQKNIVLTGHIVDHLNTVVSKTLWGNLSDADKAIFTEVMQEASARATKIIEERETSSLTPSSRRASTWSRSTRATLKDRPRKGDLRGVRLRQGRLGSDPRGPVTAFSRRPKGAGFHLRKFRAGAFQMTDQKHAPISVDEMAHAFEDKTGPADLSRYAIEDWLTLAIFWGMAACVFLQFFTRYALNNAWPGRKRSPPTVSSSSSFSVRSCACACVATSRSTCFIDHAEARRTRSARRRGPHRDRVLRLPHLVDVALGVAVVGGERMVTVDLPRGIVFYTVLAAFALMFLRAVQNFVKDMTSAKTVREQAEEADIPAGV